MSERFARCTVCRHPDRLAIEEAILRSEPVRRLAERFGIPKSTIHDHKKEQHIAEAVSKAIDAEAVSEGSALLGKVLEVEGEVRRLSQKAERQGDVRGALIGLRELGRILELLGRLSGELKSRTEVNLIVSPQWNALQARILAALAPFPAARAAVADALAGAKALPPGPVTPGDVLDVEAVPRA